MILTVKVIAITIIIKRRGRYKTPTTTNAELLVIFYINRKSLGNIKKDFPFRCCEGFIYALETAYHYLT